MKLHKVDTAAWTVREVDGEPWPGKDREGDTCYVNTHFERADAAWDKLEREARAWIEIAARAVQRIKTELQTYEQAAAAAAAALEKVTAQRPKAAP